MTHNSRSSNSDRLQAVIASAIAADPLHLDGAMWCRLGRVGLSERAGISEKTVTRLLKEQPFVSATRMVAERRTLLVRIGEPSPKDRHREVAHVLTAIWRKHLKANVAPKREAIAAEIETRKRAGETAELKEARRALERLHGDRETPREFGCFNRLAEVWPDGLQPELLKLVLDEWGDFATAIKLVAFIDPPNTGRTYQRSLDDAYLGFPSIAHVALFPGVAVDLLEMRYQASGRTPPPALIAANPTIWRHLAA